MAREMLVEERIDGVAYVAYGLMAGGEVVQCSAVRKRYPDLDTVIASCPCLGWVLSPGDPVGDRVRRFAADVIRALPGPPEVTAFHAELFLATADELARAGLSRATGGRQHGGRSPASAGSHRATVMIAGDPGMNMDDRMPQLEDWWADNCRWEPES